LQERLVVGVEPSGGYEQELVRTLLAAGFTVRWCDPARVRALARALGAPAKTDPIDARMIAHFVAATGGAPAVLDPERDELRDLLAARLAAQQGAERLEAQAATLRSAKARQALLALARQGRRQAAALGQAALEGVRSSARLAAAWRLLQTAPGVGPLVAAELLASLPELGAVSPKAIAKLTGLAPFVRQSGTWKGRAACSGGRTRPRRVLFLAAMASIRAKGGLGPRYQRLIANGKVRMVALVACMRTLIVRLNAMLRDQAHWIPHPA
jgi:transposase